ncbi:hypothetical protein J7382_13500 [Shimia sp. R11_0]|uniref:hypothetical protein n=1 Tax=Shimia sp. R11_0 TaxID=2821096 RepID=UPI001ADD06C5|nr:hypothetical protein [Shimia sp. R11_0]MBO9478557.1 hypothetical protein [Shimia sp. R11_0]
MAWHMLTAENAPYLANARLDFSTWLETTGAPPPVAFTSQADLETWASTIGTMQLVPHGRSGRAFRIHGMLKAGWYYDQIWAAKGYRGYRNLMLRQARDGFGVAPEALRGIDADHVIARTILRKLPHAWVAIFPVPAISNRPFGRIEKRLPKAYPNTSAIELSPIAALKLYCGCYPKTLAELDAAMTDIRGQIMPDTSSMHHFLDDMQRGFAPFISPS